MERKERARKKVLDQKRDETSLENDKSRQKFASFIRVKMRGFRTKRMDGLVLYAYIYLHESSE